MSNRRPDEEAIFHVAREIPNPEARARYLDQVCDGDQGLRDRVLELLRVNDEEQDFLKSSPEPAPTVDQAPITERPGTTIGRFRLMEQIGEGGMGVVFVAEQQRPLQRKVALKVIKPGMDSKQVIARFDAERQALAMMDHPNIAKALDAGTTESGRPYFVMELVRGVPITEYCDENKLSIGERLDLFTQVCQAIQHAHQKGIIHRDIKPSNVLVTVHDDKPVIKVIDFGVAKAINQRITEQTIYTGFAQAIGTPLYMSPEQAGASGLDVDTRTDIYSLGVLLYELLTGTTPFDKKEFDKAAYEEIRRIIREQEPARPSARISTLGATLGSVSAQRKMEPQRLCRFVRGDLDWIVMKSLEKDRTRRYDTASRFAQDIQRFLASELVEARPPSTRYRLQKLWQRNKTLTSSVAAVFLALTIGLAVASWAVVAVNSTNRELERALREWRHELIDRGIEAAFRGDIDAVFKIATKATAAGVPPDWCLLLEGLACDYGDERGRATVLLGQAHDMNPDNVAVAAALSMSQGYGVWNQSEYEKLIMSLQEATPSGEFQEYERLLLGWSQLYVDSTLSMQMIREADESCKRAWPIAKVFLACAEAHVAMDKADAELAMQAVQHAKEAEELLDSNPFPKSIGLWARSVAMSLVGETDDVTYGNLRRECRELVEALRDHQATYEVPGLTAMFLDMTDDPRAEQAFLELSDDDWWGACRAAYFYRLGKMKTAEPHANDIEAMALAAVVRFAILAAQGNNVEAMEGYEAIKRAHPSSYARAFAMQIPLIAGRSEKASNDARDWLRDNDVPDFPFYLARTRLQYHADPSTQQAMLQTVQGSRLGQCYAHYAIAIQHLADDPAFTREQLEKCLATGQFWCPEYHMAKALLAQHPEIQEQEAQSRPRLPSSDVIVPSEHASAGSKVSPHNHKSESVNQ